MSNGLLLVIAGGAGAALVSALVAWFWQNRAQPRRDPEASGLPLFGSDLEMRITPGRGSVAIPEAPRAGMDASDATRAPTPPSSPAVAAAMRGSGVASGTPAGGGPVAGGRAPGAMAAAQAPGGHAARGGVTPPASPAVAASGAGAVGEAAGRAVLQEWVTGVPRGAPAADRASGPRAPTPGGVPGIAYRPMSGTPAGGVPRTSHGMPHGGTFPNGASAHGAFPPRMPTPAAGSSGSFPAIDPATVPGATVEGHLLRFQVPAEGTLQFLPGRLEVVSGADSGREIRFVRIPGPEGYVVTFGRADGPVYRHVQLREQTVSRAHARMKYVNGDWQLTNQSQTNPTLLNGAPLAPGESRYLQDGDRVEMGEVAFSFRGR